MRRINVNGVMTPAMERSMIVTHTVHQVKKNFFWGCINGAILAIIIYDIVYTCPFYSETFRTIELVVAVVFGINMLYHFGRYFLTTVNIQPVVVSPVQKQLLGFKNSDSYVKTSTPVSTNTCSSPISPNTTPMNLSACSWLSSPLMSVSDFDDSKLSGNLSMSSPSWLYMSGNTPQKSPVSPMVRRPLSVLNRSTLATSLDMINDEYSLNRYLKEYDGLEKSSVVGKSMEQPSNLLSMFWSHPVTRSPSEANPILRRCTYQMAINAPELAMNTTRSSDETGSSLNCDAEVWRTFKINKNNLIQWIANLRMWISQTILERLVCEIKYINAALQANGLVDVCIGEVGLDRLRKTAQIPLVVQNIASLPCLVPFLEVSPNQEYVVSRIRELARGGCMSDFKWNSGGAFDGKEWAEHLPTDAALVLHLWATYLDSQLPPLPSMPDGHPFSSLYLIKSPNKPSKVPLAISQVTENPPHYQLAVGDEVHHVPKGRNNLFYTILLFLHQIKTKEHGMLGRMNLGRSGVNMLWVIES